jgi:hypothetical protein
LPFVRALRNIAIIAIIAIPVAFVPAGGDAADGVVAALQLAFLAAIGAMGFMLYRQSRFKLDTMPDGQRALLYGAFGAIALFFAAGGNLIWIGLMVAAGAAIFWLLRSSESY